MSDYVESNGVVEVGPYICSTKASHAQDVQESPHEAVPQKASLAIVEDNEASWTVVICKTFTL